MGNFIPRFLARSLTDAARRAGERMTTGNSYDSEANRMYQWAMIVRWDDSVHIVALRALLDETW